MSWKMFIVVLMLPVATACAQSEAPSDSLNTEDVARFTKACTSTSNMGEELCECAAKKAKADLNETEFAFLLATLEEDEEETERLRGEMGPMEAMKAGMFLVNAPAACARDGAKVGEGSDGGQS